VSAAQPLQRRTVVDELAEVLRGEILNGAIAPGTPLREVELAAAYDVSRHTLRAALRLLAVEGVVEIEPHRGARVASLDRDQLLGLFEVRTALEVEGARLALERNDGRLPAAVHDDLARLAAATRKARVPWSDVAALHADFHAGIVGASGSDRLRAEYARLTAELRLFLVQLRPVWSLERMRTHHEELVAGLETEGPEALRRHLRDGAGAVLAALG
jgi:DNA-binding GntR family transcriptional regulator